MMNHCFKNSKWIWYKDTKEKNQYIKFINDFEISGCVIESSIYISVDSNYALWINSKFVDFGQYSDMPYYKIYDKINIEKYLCKGKNRLCILANYKGEENTSVYYKSKPGLIYEIEVNGNIIAKSDENNKCCMDNAYKNGDIEDITPQLGYTYHYDACKEDNWISQSYDSFSDWQNSVIVDKSMQLFERPIEKLKLKNEKEAEVCSQGAFIENKKYENSTIAEKMQHAYLSYKSFCDMAGTNISKKLPSKNGIEFKSDEGDGIYIIIDLLSEQAGILKLSLETKDEAQIDIGFGEHLKDLRVRTYVGNRNFALSYRCKKGRNEFNGYFKRLGCRYLELYVHASNIKLYYAGVMPVCYPVKELNFEISDKLHKKIYENCIRTLKLCMHEHYEDCPWREQALYNMDSRTQMLICYYAFGEYKFARASLKLFSLNVRDDNLLSLCAPANIYITIPSFNLIYFVQVYEYVLFSGDISFGNEVFECCRNLMKVFINRIKENGLISNFIQPKYWNFYEWSDGLAGEICPPNDVPETFDAPLNAYLSMALQNFSKLCKMLGKIKEAEYYEGLSKNINDAINKNFWIKERGAYCTYMNGQNKYHFAQLTQALIVCCNACSKDNIDVVLEKLFDKNFVPITLSYSIFKYDALLKNNPDKYGKKVFDEIAEVWGNMLFNNATSFWETEKGDSDFDDAGSLCHGWSAVPIYIYYRYGLGIEPAKPAFKEYEINGLKDTGVDCIKAEINMVTKRIIVANKKGSINVSEKNI